MNWSDWKGEEMAIELADAKHVAATHRKWSLVRLSIPAMIALARFWNAMRVS